MEQHLIQIRQSLVNDYDAVYNILKTTWLDTYTRIVPEDDLLWYLDTEYSKAKYEIILLDTGAQAFLALINNTPAGWMRLRFADDCLNVVSLYILPLFQGKGLGKVMLDHAKQIAIRKEYMFISLGVMSNNIKSKQWYEHQGFKFTTEEPFILGKTKILHLIGTKQVSE